MFSYKSKQSAKVREYRSSCPTRKLNSGCRASNYSLTSLICTTICEGYGFGLSTSCSATGFMDVLAVSPVWLCHSRCGPLQWVWRSRTYRKKQPFG